MFITYLLVHLIINFFNKHWCFKKNRCDDIVFHHFGEHVNYLFMKTLFITLYVDCDVFNVYYFFNNS
jgi:hypothetical protein